MGIARIELGGESEKAGAGDGGLVEAAGDDVNKKCAIRTPAYLDPSLPFPRATPRYQTFTWGYVGLRYRGRSV